MEAGIATAKKAGRPVEYRELGEGWEEPFPACVHLGGDGGDGLQFAFVDRATNHQTVVRLNFEQAILIMQQVVDAVARIVRRDK
jgi:hypothetical protein